MIQHELIHTWNLLQHVHMGSDPSLYFFNSPENRNLLDRIHPLIRNPPTVHAVQVQVPNKPPRLNPLTRLLVSVEYDKNNVREAVCSLHTVEKSSKIGDPPMTQLGPRDDLRPCIWPRYCGRSALPHACRCLCSRATASGSCQPRSGPSSAFTSWR